MASFIFGDERIPFEKAQSNSNKDFKSQVLNFASAWLSTKNEFEFQTSGSTGQPKKITFTRAQLRASAQLTINTFQISRGSKALLCLEPNFVAGKMMIVRALENEMDLICIPPSSNPLDRNLESEIEFAALVPYQLEAIIRSEKSLKALNQIKTVIVGGAAVSLELEQKLQELPTSFFETYGMTETLTHFAIRKLNPSQDFFHALSGIQVGVDEENCLSIQASHLGSGIIQTNDVVEFINKTSFRLLGRRDNIINSAGVKIHPETIEGKLSGLIREQLEDRQYFITGMRDTTFGEKLVLVIEGESINVNKQSFINSCKELLQKWEAPKDIIFVSEFTRTTSGKINRELTKRSLSN